MIFYNELFGWEAESLMALDSPGQYFLCRLHGGRSAVVTPHGGRHSLTPVCSTFICVESAVETAAHGGSGRPQGAVFTVSQLIVVPS